MIKIAKLGLLIALPLLAISLVTIVGSGEVSAQNDNKTTQTQNKSKSSEVYNYTAQSGDSYTLMARKSVQDYSKNNKSNLSQAQIIFAETTLTQAAGSPILEIGQKVSIKKADVKSAVDKAKKLTPTQQAAWAQYTAGANFDTSQVGVAR